MPSTVGGGERVDLIGYHCSKAPKQETMVDSTRDEHCLERLGCCEQDVWGITEDGSARAVANVAVPELDSTAEPRCVLV
jgi:hypothetical protein